MVGMVKTGVHATTQNLANLTCTPLGDRIHTRHSIQGNSVLNHPATGASKESIDVSQYHYTSGSAVYIPLNSTFI